VTDTQEEHKATTKRVHIFLKQLQERLDHFKPIQQFLHSGILMQLDKEMQLSKDSMQKVLFAFSIGRHIWQVKCLIGIWP